MTRILCSAAAFFIVFAAPGAANAAVTVSQPFSLTGGVGQRSSLSALSVDASPEIAWTMNITSVTVSGMLVGPVTFPVTLPLTDPNYGVSVADLSDSGNFAGALPADVFSHRFTLVEVGQIVPTYDFTVKLVITDERKLQPTVIVHTLTQFNPFGVTNSPFMTPLSSLTVAGTATASTVPAPAAACLPLAGLGLAAARRRRA